MRSTTWRNGRLSSSAHPSPIRASEKKVFLPFASRPCSPHWRRHRNAPEGARISLAIRSSDNGSEAARDERLATSPLVPLGKLHRLHQSLTQRRKLFLLLDDAV